MNFALGSLYLPAPRTHFLMQSAGHRGLLSLSSTNKAGYLEIKHRLRGGDSSGCCISQHISHRPHPGMGARRLHFQ